MRRSTMFLLIVLATFLGGARTNAAAQGLLTRPQLGILGGVTVPTGEFGEDASTGWNAGAFFKIRMYGPIDARLDGSFNRLGTKSFEFADADIDLDTDISIATLGALVNLGPDSAAYPGDNSISPYIMLGIGAYRFKSDGTCEGAGCSAIDVSDFTKTKAGFNIGAGANIPLGGIPLIAEFKYHRFGVTFPGNRLDGTATMMTGTVGIKIR